MRLGRQRQAAALLGVMLLAGAYVYWRQRSSSTRGEKCAKDQGQQKRVAPTRKQRTHRGVDGTGDNCATSDNRGSGDNCGVEIEETRVASNQLADLGSRVLPLQLNDEREENWIDPSKYICYVKTFGCTHNTSDSETMCGVLKENGFPIGDDLEGADVVVLNSCTVKNPSQDSAVNLALKSRARGQFVVLAGCVVQADTQIHQLQGFSAIGVNQLDKVAEAVIETLQGNVYLNVSTGPSLPSLTLPRVRKSDLIEIIPLSTGCLGACTYCKTRFARGALNSYNCEAILRRVKEAVAEGCQQLWLSSEDTGAYGIDKGTNISELLWAIDKVLVATEEEAGGKTVMVRVGMTNPPYILEHIESVGEVLRGKHWFKFIHIPVQSGSNCVLERMKREYTREEFLECVQRLRAAVPNITIATDIICGFPGETEAQHAETRDLILSIKPPVVNISQFYPRPGTPAAKYPQVQSKTKKQRSTDITNAFMSYTTYDHFVGRQVDVWVEGRSAKSDHLVAHTCEYVKVLLDPLPLFQLGAQYKVLVVSATKWHLYAQPVGSPQTHPEYSQPAANQPADNQPLVDHARQLQKVPTWTTPSPASPALAIDETNETAAHVVK